MRNDFQLNVSRSPDDVVVKGFVDDEKNVIITEPDLSGSSAGILKINFIYDDDIFICDHTWREINDVFSNGGIVVFQDEYTTENTYSSYQYPVNAMFYAPSDQSPGMTRYLITFSPGDLSAETLNADDYPVLDR